MAEAPKNPPLTEAQKEAIQREKDKRLYDLETQAGAPTPERPVNTPKKYAKGGSIRGSGCESRGKTKGRFV
jgi:hypothetical protein